MKNINCSFCGSSTHTSKTCQIEPSMAPIFKQEIGIFMEKYIVNNIKCPKCKINSLNRLGTNTPSLDMICNNCNSMFEIKSKCLSIDIMPNHIFFNGGNYLEFNRNINNGLELILIIYGINRKEKMLTIRTILYVPNNILKDNNTIEIHKSLTHSKINIKNINNINTISILNNTLSFKKLYQNLLIKYYYKN